jgi:L-fuconolactonase
MIDTHHHFWQYNAAEYAWITEEMAVLRNDFLPMQLAQTLSGTGVDGVISVQARSSIEETEFLLDQATTCSLVKGIVGWVPLTNPKVGPILDRFSANPLFKGVREILQGEPDAAYFQNPDFHRGLRELTARNLPYDLLIYAPQLRSAIDFVDEHPNQRFILDHIAKPTITAGAFDTTWAQFLLELAKRQNVVCKFSGVLTEVRDAEWNLDLIRPYFETALAAFGPQRLMFGSDWPVCRLRCQYRDWLETCRLLAASLSQTDQAAFFQDNAIRAYGI